MIVVFRGGFKTGVSVGNDGVIADSILPVGCEEPVGEDDVDEEEIDVARVEARVS